MFKNRKNKQNTDILYSKLQIPSCIESFSNNKCSIRMPIDTKAFYENIKQKWYVLHPEYFLYANTEYNRVS